MKRPAITFDVEAARAMRATGACWTTMSVRFGVSYHVLRTRLEPGYAERRAADNREVCPGKIDHGDYMSPEAKRDAYKRLAEIPADTRELTGRLMGDPLPGRRGLDKPRGS